MFCFQATSWSDADIRFDDITSEERSIVHTRVGSQTEENLRSHYVVTVYGRCDDGRSVATRLLGFNPFLYVRIGSGECTVSDVDVFQVIRHVVEKVGELQVRDVQVVSLKEYYGYTNDEKRQYVKISLYSKSTMRLLSTQPEISQKPSHESLWGSKIFLGNKGWQDIHVYEAHIHLNLWFGSHTCLGWSPLDGFSFKRTEMHSKPVTGLTRTFAIALFSISLLQ